MDLADRIQAIDDLGRALLDDAGAAPHAPVPACPGWDAAELVHHIAVVHAFWADVVGTRRVELGDRPEPVAPIGEPFEARLERAAHSRAALVDALRTTPPATAVWSWSHDHSADFVGHWQVLEALVHRVDAADAAGRTVADVTPEVAAAALDALLRWGLGAPGERPDAVPGPVALEATDTETRWTVHADATVHRDASSAVTTTLRGRALDLVLVLYQRRPLATLEVRGDRAFAERFVAS